MTVAGLVLAAGGATRFGGPKVLATLDGRPLVELVAATLADGGCRPVVTVLGAHAAAVSAAATLEEVVVNERWEDGVASSLDAGLAALDGRCDAVVVALADQPLVGAEAVRRLVVAWRDGAAAAVVTHAGEPRNPVLLARSTWDAVRAEAQGEVGARAWLRAHPERVVHVPGDGTGSPDDVDTPDDLERLRHR